MRQSTLVVLIAYYGFGAASATAQTAVSGTAPVYPVKPLRLLFGYTAGGAGDVSARLLAHKLSEHLGQNVVVENRPGAGGAIADEAVARSPADGYTLLYAAGSTAILPALRAKLPYDVERDFAPVSLVVITSFALTLHPSVPVHDVKALIALARAQPGKLAFSSPGIVRVANTPEMKEAYFKQEFETQTNTPEQFAAFIRRELAQNAKLVKFAGIKPE